MDVEHADFEVPHYTSFWYLPVFNSARRQNLSLLLMRLLQVLEYVICASQRVAAEPAAEGLLITSFRHTKSIVCRFCIGPRHKSSFLVERKGNSNSRNPETSAPETRPTPPHKAPKSLSSASQPRRRHQKPPSPPPKTPPADPPSSTKSPPPSLPTPTPSHSRGTRDPRVCSW